MINQDKNTIEKVFTKFYHYIDIAINIYVQRNSSNPHLSYEDLQQVGSIALLRAIKTYDPSKGASFRSYAIILIKNSLIDYIRQQNKISNKSESLEVMGELTDKTFDDKINHILIESFLNQIKKNYSSTVIKGIDAIMLRLNGYTNKDIADIYGVKSNEVSAWISRASKILKNSKEVREFFEIDKFV